MEEGCCNAAQAPWERTPQRALQPLKEQGLGLLSTEAKKRTCSAMALQEACSHSPAMESRVGIAFCRTLRLRSVKPHFLPYFRWFRRKSFPMISGAPCYKPMPSCACSLCYQFLGMPKKLCVSEGFSALPSHFSFPLIQFRARKM